MYFVFSRLLFAVFIFNTLATPLEKVIGDFTEKCSKEFDIGKEIALNTNGTIPDSKKCFFKCLAVNMGLTDDTGKIDLATAKKNIPPNLPKDLPGRYEDCIKKNKMTDSCDSAKFVLECIFVGNVESK